MDEINIKNVTQTGMIITLSREIEMLMTKLGATAAGLHDKTDLLAPKLPDECVKLLHYIAAVRNKNAHETVDFHDVDMELFTESCEVVMIELKKLLPDDDKEKHQVKKVTQINFENKDIAKEFKKEAIVIFKLFCFIPLLNIIFFIFALSLTMQLAITKIIGVIFSFLSLIIISGSLIKKDYETIKVGITLLIITYIYGVIIYLIERKQKLKYDSLSLIPVVNIFYFICGCYYKIAKLKFLYYLALILSYILGLVIFFKYSNIELCFWILGVNYLVGAITGLFFKVVSKKEPSAT